MSRRRGAWLERACSLALLSGLLLLNGCGKAAGRLAFTGEGTQSASVPLAAGDVAFWTDVSLKYRMPALLVYRIELEQGGIRVASVECNALEQHVVKLGWIEVRVGGLRSISGSGQMLCSTHLAKAGLTKVRATLAFDYRPTTLNFEKADLVIKQ